MSNSHPYVVSMQIAVESMRHSVVSAMLDHQGDIQKRVEEEISSLMTGDYLEDRIRKAVRQNLDAAIEAEVRQTIFAHLRNTPSISKRVTEAVLESFARGSVGDE